MKTYFVPFAIASVIALAGCSNEGGDAATAEATEPAAAVEAPVTEETPATEAAPVEPAAAEAAPATEEAEPAAAEPAQAAPAMPDADAMAGQAMQMLTPEAQEALQTQVDSMSDEDKQRAVDQARTAAEDAARQQGLSDEMIQQVGDQAEAAAREMFALPD